MNTLQLSTILAITSLASVSASAATVTLRADNWCPYNCDPSSNKPGYMVEIAKYALAKGGHTVDYKEMNWTRAISEAEKGNIDGIIGASEGDAKGLIFPKESLGKSDNAFFVKFDSSWSYTNKSSLKGTKVGIIQSYDYGAMSKIIEETAKPQIASGDNALEINFKKLIAGRIDNLIEDSNVAKLKASEMGLADKVKEAGVEGDPSEFYIAFTPNKESSKEYAKLLSDGVIELRNSGQLEKIMAKYGLSDWK